MKGTGIFFFFFFCFTENADKVSLYWYFMRLKEYSVKHSQSEKYKEIN